MRTALLSIGSNLNNPAQHVVQAIELLEKQFGPISASSLYATKPVGMDSDISFINAAVRFQTMLSAEALMDELLDMERAAGRIRTQEEGYQSRPLDLDIILLGDEIIEENIRIPHPRFRQRRFVLEPACEIAPELIDPVSRRSIKDLLLDCGDCNWVHRLEEELEIS